MHQTIDSTEERISELEDSSKETWRIHTFFFFLSPQNPKLRTLDNNSVSRSVH